MHVHREVSLFVYITDLIFFLCLVARLVLSEPQLRVEVEYIWFMGYRQVTVMMMTILGMIFPAVMFPVLQVRWEQNHISSVIIIIHSGSLSRAIRLAAQSALLSMQAESLLVHATPASLIRVSMNEDTRWPRRKSLYSVNQICFFLAAWVKKMIIIMIIIMIIYQTVSSVIERTEGVHHTILH